MALKITIRRILLFPLDKVEQFVKRTNWYTNIIPDLDNYPGDSWYRNHLERNYDIVNIGSSSAVFCFKYEGLGVKAFNWALRPQSMEYGFKVLKQYFSVLKPNGIVLIPFSPFSGLSVTGKWNEKSNDKYFHILNSTLIDNYNSVARRRKYPFRTAPIVALKRLIKDVPKVNMNSYDIECKSKDDFYINANQWIASWKHEFGILDLNAPLSPENMSSRENRLQTIREIVFFCRDRDLCPIIVVPPVHNTMNELLSSQFVYNYMTSFFEDLSDLRLDILNYLDDPNFMRDVFFRDSFFMSEIGAREFTKQLLTDLALV